MMMKSGRTPKMPIVTSAGAVSSQRLMRALSSLRVAACCAVDSGVDGAGSGATGPGTGGAKSVVVISVLQHLHRLGCDAQADGVALLEDLLEAAAVLHANGDIPAGFEINMEMGVGPERDDLHDRARDLAVGARLHQVDALRADRQGDRASDRGDRIELALDRDSRGQTNLPLVSDPLHDLGLDEVG